MRTLHHLALGTLDVERVVAFYRDLLGLAEHTRHNHPDGTLRSIWLELGHHAVLMIEQTDQKTRQLTGIGAGFFLLTIAIKADERSDLEAQLTAAGHPIESRTEFTSYTRDPEGNRVAISHYPLEKPAP